jgi:hypothetical protein
MALKQSESVIRLVASNVVNSLRCDKLDDRTRFITCLRFWWLIARLSQRPPTRERERDRNDVTLQNVQPQDRAIIDGELEHVTRWFGVLLSKNEFWGTLMMSIVRKMASSSQWGLLPSGVWRSVLSYIIIKFRRLTEAAGYSETSVPMIQNQTKDDLKFDNAYMEASGKYELIITARVSAAFLLIITTGKLQLISIVFLNLRIRWRVVIYIGTMLHC